MKIDLREGKVRKGGVGTKPTSRPPGAAPGQGGSYALDVAMLHSLICFWRVKRDLAGAGSEDQLVARCYVDAFQTVLVNHDLPMLPTDGAIAGGT